LADLDENIIRRSLPFGVDTSIGAVETHASENLILHDSEICDYSDRLLGVQRKLDDELIQLALCDGDRERCVSPAALRFLAIVDNAKAREGRARLGEINRAINLAIHPMSDLAQYREIAWLDFNFKLVKSMLHCN
jgi:hypothetical protein